MQKYQNNVAYAYGAPVVGASVLVKDYPSGTTATIYSDDGVTQAANPLTTDASGNFAFYAADGHYSVTVSGTGFTTYTLSDIILEDLVDHNSEAVPDTLLGWNDYVSDIYAIGPDAATIANSFGNYYHYEFPDGAMKECVANFHILHDYANGTPIYPHFHIMTTSSNAGVVRIGFEYSIAKRSDSSGATTFSTPATVYVNYNIPANSENLHMVVQVDANNTIPGTIVEPDTMICVRIFRDAADVADTFAASIFGIKADLHYQVARLCTLNRDPDFFA